VDTTDKTEDKALAAGKEDAKPPSKAATESGAGTEEKVEKQAQEKAQEAKSTDEKPRSDVEKPSSKGSEEVRAEEPKGLPEKTEQAPSVLTKQFVSHGSFLGVDIPSGLQEGSCVSFPVTYLGGKFFIIEFRSPENRNDEKCTYGDHDLLPVHARFANEELGFAIVGAGHKLGGHDQGVDGYTWLWEFKLKEVRRCLCVFNTRSSQYVCRAKCV
jgi:hypothetical protein